MVSIKHLKLFFNFFFFFSYVLSQHKHTSDKQKHLEFRTSSALDGMEKTNCSCAGANEAWFPADSCVVVD